MRLLLDTHIALWWFSGETERIGPEAVGEITEAEDVFVSAASAWEIEIKRALGKLDAPRDVAEARRVVAGSNQVACDFCVEVTQFAQQPLPAAQPPAF